ncbi:unnamed protein product [Rhizopus microsporus]
MSIATRTLLMNMEALRGEMKVVLVYIKDTQGLKSYSSSMAEISSLGHYAAYRLNPYEMYERKDQYYFA